MKLSITKKTIKITLIFLCLQNFYGISFAQVGFLDLSNEQEIFNKLKQELNQLEEEIPRLESILYTTKTNKSLYWGYGDGYFDMTWYPLLGFVIPGLPQVINVFDGSSPAWLRTTSFLQLVSLGVFSAGLVQTYDFNPQPQYDLFSQSNSSPLATGLLLGGASAYAILGILPSTIVFAHDSSIEAVPPSKVYEISAEINHSKKRISDLKVALNIYSLVINENYPQALQLLNYSSQDIKTERNYLSRRYTDRWKEHADTLKRLEQSRLLQEAQALREREEIQRKKIAEQKRIEEENQLSKKYWYAAVEQASKGNLTQGIDNASEVKPGTPHYNQAQQKIKEWKDLQAKREKAIEARQKDIEVKTYHGEWFLHISEQPLPKNNLRNSIIATASIIQTGNTLQGHIHLPGGSRCPLEKGKLWLTGQKKWGFSFGCSNLFFEGEITSDDPKLKDTNVDYTINGMVYSYQNRYIKKYFLAGTVTIK